jgi:hypothetical protein
MEEIKTPEVEVTTPETVVEEATIDKTEPLEVVATDGDVINPLTDDNGTTTAE